MRHPLQPVERDGDDTLRFKPNKIVQFLLTYGGTHLHTLETIQFPNEDREQFAQLIGYNVDEFCALPYVSDETKGLTWTAVVRDQYGLEGKR